MDEKTQEIIDLFSDIHFSSRKVGLVAPPISETTEGGLLKSPQQVAEEKQQVGLNGALVVGSGAEALADGAVPGNFGYPRSHIPEPELAIDRGDLRLMIFDMAVIPIYRKLGE